MTLLSTFSSKRWMPIWTVILSIGFGLVIVLAVEVWIRSLGAVPSYDNTISRWALVRSQLENDTSPQAVAVLGASRAQGGLSHSVLRETLPGATVYNLSYVGKTPYETLADIADNTEFRGLVIISLLPAWLLPDQGRHDQIEMVQYYHNHWNFARAAETKIGNFVAGRMALRNNYHSFSRLIRNVAQSGRPIQQLNNVVIGEDRQQFLTIPDVDKARKRAQEWSENVIAEGRLAPQDIDWNAAYLDLSEKIGKILARGGNVVLLRMPSSDIVYETESLFFPRTQFWDKMIESVPANGIHFEDVPGIEAIELPDYSHVPASSRDAFSELMVGAIADTLIANGSTRFDFESGNNDQ